jgi:penicillin-binding protein 1A
MTDEVEARSRAGARGGRRWRALRFTLLALVGLGLLGAAIAAGAYFYVVRGLPNAGALASYEPPLPTNIRDINGRPMRMFARERRVFLPYEDMPPLLVAAFISAEDKTFFEHSGLDYPGIFQAVLTNIETMGSGRRPVGASTITQQLAKNLLLTNELSLVRKAREAVLARRIEEIFTKEQILELYLNQIFLGRNAYGVEAASQAYFDKSTRELKLEEIAFLAVLPKAPANYNPVSHREQATARRDWVLGQMAANGYITPVQLRDARAMPLETVRPASRVVDRTGDYFVEDVRRALIERFGETAEDGANSVYAGGLWVRTSFDPRLQRAAAEAMRDGLVRYDRLKGWYGPPARIELGDGWAERLRAVNLPVGYDDWRAAVVLAGGSVLRLGFIDGSEGRMPAHRADMRKGNGTAADLLRPGDVIPVERVSGNEYALRQIPQVSGGMVVEEARTGRVLAMVGGFDARASQFNRATQALRQPGSAFKPFVYATALDNGFTPSSIIVDGPFCVFQSRRLGQKCFRNFGGGSAGPRTMRWGLEQSRNLMTVRTAYNVGMDKVTDTARKMGIGDYPEVLAVALGAGETTVLKLTNAYAMLVDHGRALRPTVIDYVQDRKGKVIWRADERLCERCNMPEYDGQPMPRPAEVRRQAMDPRTAFQVVHMLEGVVQRGTATRLRDLDRPIMGKTGTTSGPTDAWFVGGTPDLVAGLYVGYDTPRNLGGWVQGGNLAAPIWKSFAQAAFKDAPALPFQAPGGIRMVRVDRMSGKRVFGVWPTEQAKAAVIWEAFKPESEPRRIARASSSAPAVVRSDADFLQSTGGIY